MTFRTIATVADLGHSKLIAKLWQAAQRCSLHEYAYLRDPKSPLGLQRATAVYSLVLALQSLRQITIAESCKLELELREYLPQRAEAMMQKLWDLQSQGMSKVIDDNPGNESEALAASLQTSELLGSLTRRAK